MPEIDNLSISIKASADSAEKSLDRLVDTIGRISASLGGVNFSGFAQGAKNLSTAMQGLQNVKMPDYTRLANGIAKIGTINSSQIQQAGVAIRELSGSLKYLDSINVSDNSKQIAELANGIAKLGYKSSTQAITNIPKLASAMKELMATLSTAPRVSQNLIDMTNALAKLSRTGASSGKAANSLGSALNRYSSQASKATSRSRSLASMFGSMYANLWWVIKGVKALGKGIEESMNYIEILNYFNNAWNQVAESADVSQFEQFGYKSAEIFANSFSERAKQVTSELTGFNVMPNGELVERGQVSLGINPSQVMNYQAMFGQMASSIGMSAENSLLLSEALTKIGADLASVKNMEFEEVWTNMASGLAGMSRTLDKYGVNIRNVNLQQKLLDLGINANIANLNQNDKAMLRTIILLESTGYAYGDLAETINAPANQLRLLKANFTNLARTIGNLFLQVVSKVLPYINGLVIALQRLFTWIGGLLGIDLSEIISSSGSSGGGIEDLIGDTEDLEDGLDGATDSAKKLKRQLQGFDELNNLSSDNAAASSAVGGNLGGLLDDAFLDAINDYLKAWDEAFANLENRANEIADKIQEFALKVWNAIEPFRTALKQLWDEGLSKLANFTWTALEDFYEEFLKPLGEWAFGEEDKGLTAFVNTLNDLLNNIDWESLNTALENLWIALEPFAENVGDGLNWLFREVLSPLAEFLVNNVLIDAIEGLADAFEILNDVIEVLSPIITTFWEEFGKEAYAETLEKIAGAVDSLLNPFESLKDLLEDFSWDNFLEYAKDVADFALLLSNPMAYFTTQKTDSGSEQHASAGGQSHGGGGGFRSGEKNLLDTAKESFNQLTESISEPLETIKKNVHDAFEKIKNTISIAVGTAKLAVVKKWNEMMDGLSEKIEKFKEDAKEKFETIKENISDAIGKVEDVFSDFKTTIDNVVKSIKDFFGFSGKEFKLKLPSLDDFAKGIGNLVDKLKELFGFDGKTVEVDTSKANVNPSNYSANYSFFNPSNYSASSYSAPVVLQSSTLQTLNTYESNSYSSNDYETKELLREILAAVKDGKVLEMDGRSVGKVIQQQDNMEFARTGRGLFYHPQAT